MAEDGEVGARTPDVPYTSLLNLPLSSDLDRIGEQMHALARAQRSLQGLLDAVMGISGNLELPGVLRRIVRTAMDLVGRAGPTHPRPRRRGRPHLHPGLYPFLTPVTCR